MTKHNTITGVINAWAKTQPQKTAFYLPASDHSYSYLGLRQTLQQYHGYLSQFGLQPGDLFVCAFNNSTALLELLLGGFYNGYIVVPLNLVAGEKASQYVLNHSQPKVIFANADQAKILSKQVDGIQIVTLDENQSPLAQLNASMPDYEPEIKPDQSALLMYTSGTTGNPKGVLLSHANLIAGGTNTKTAHELSDQDIGMCCLPLYHINAQCVSLMSTLVSGSSLVLADRFRVSNFFTTIIENQVTWVSVVPTMLSYLLHALEEDPDSWNVEQITKTLVFIRSASSALPIEVHQTIENLLHIPIIETMGITETSAQILANPRPPKQRKIGSVGLPFGNQIKVLKSGQTCPINVEGEICVKGPNVMRQYYKNPEATKASFTEDGWFLTGDLGMMDDEGYIKISGRKKELIIKGGENISPREIDEILYAIPGVIEAAAFGRSCTSYGQVVEACVKVDANVTVEQLMTHCKEQLGAFKCPEKFHFLDELPKGPSGKIQRLKLEQILYPESA